MSAYSKRTFYSVFRVASPCTPYIRQVRLAIVTSLPGMSLFSCRRQPNFGENMWKLLRKKLKQIKIRKRQAESPCYDTAMVYERSASMEEIPLVLDCGTHTSKIGFAGEDKPRAEFDTSLRQIYKNAKSDVESLGVLGDRVSYSSPMRRGVVIDWNAMEKVWQHSFNTLGVSSRKHPVLLSEIPFASMNSREKTTEILFEQFDTPAMYSIMQPVLALYGSGYWSGTVLDSGEGSTHIVPVYEGYPCEEAIVRFPVAGCDLTDYLKLILDGRGQLCTKRAVVSKLKEELCYVLRNPWQEIDYRCGSTSELRTCKLDSQVFSMERELCYVPECIFNPELYCMDCKGIDKMIPMSVDKCHQSIREHVSANLVLSGGTTLLSGFVERLRHQLALLSNKLNVYAPSVRKYSAWSGGSMVASLSTFKPMWIRRTDYEEYGPSVILKKCSWKSYYNPSNYSVLL